MIMFNIALRYLVTALVLAVTIVLTTIVLTTISIVTYVFITYLTTLTFGWIILVGICATISTIMTMDHAIRIGFLQ